MCFALDCATCDLDRREDESDADWKARLWGVFNTSSEACVNGHPWNDENTQRSNEGWRYCRPCRREQEVQRKGVA